MVRSSGNQHVVQLVWWKNFALVRCNGIIDEWGLHSIGREWRLEGKQLSQGIEGLGMMENV